MSQPLLIAGGTVVTDGGRAEADVLLRDGRVAAVGAVRDPAATVVRADGCLVLPGAVDPHTHVFGAAHADGVAALCGGTTSALVFVDGDPGETPAAAAERGVREQIPESPIDLGFHGVVWEPEAYRDGDLAALADAGVTSVKLWLAYRELGIMADDAQVHAIMAEAAREGVLVQAHCENGGAVADIAQRLRDRGTTALSEHGRARPIGLEAEAVHRLLRFAEVTGADTYVVHVSGREPLEEILRARMRGQTVFAETCAHHLVLDDRVYAGDDALRFMMTPPLRAPADCDALWEGLRSGAIDTLASDHGHLRLDADKVPAADDVTAVPYGIPGIQWRLALGMTHGVRAGRLSLERLVEVACAAPARAFGLYPRKGTLRPGADADLVVWDPTRTVVVGDDSRRDGLDYSPYDGMALQGPPRIVVAGGEVVAEDGVFLGREAPARFLPRPRRTAVGADLGPSGDGLAAAR